MADYSNYAIQSTGGLTPDPTTGGYSDAYGNKYDANGNPIDSQQQSATNAILGTSKKSAGSSAASTGIEKGAGFVGGGVGGAIGYGVGGIPGAVVGNEIGNIAGSVGGSILGGVTGDEKETEVQKMQEQSAKYHQMAQKQMYRNHGGDAVIGSIAKYPNNPVMAMADARSTLGRQLTPEEQKAILKGGYNTVSQGAAREGVIYDNNLRQIQKQQNLRKLFGAGIGLAALAAL